ncbi:hypothetical protein EGW08_001393, partial [Elysia chlorotica]
MASILNCGYVQPKAEIWNLFLPGLCQPCPASNSLLTALICHGLPESYEPSIVGSCTSSSNIGRERSLVNTSRARPLYPLRRCLIRWLIPSLDIDESGAFSSDHFKRTNLSPSTVAEILYTLTVQNLTPIIREKNNVSNYRIHSQDSLEAMYLDNLFEMSNHSHHNMSSSSVSAADKPSDAECFAESPHIASVLEYLRMHLIQVARNLESLEPGIQTLECASWFGCVLAKLLHRLLSHSESKTPELRSGHSGDSGDSAKICGPHTASLNAFEKNVCCVIERCAALFVAHVKKEDCAGLRATLGHMSSMLDLGGDCDRPSDKAAIFRVAQLVRSALPASFVDMLIEILYGKVSSAEAIKSKGRYSMSRPQSASVEKRTLSHSSKDPDWDMFDWLDGSNDRETSRRSSDDTDDMDLGITVGAKSCLSLKNVKDFLCETLLTETEHVQLGSLRLLVSLISFNAQGAPDTMSSEGGMDVDFVKSKMLQRVSIAYFDPALPLDVHILLTLINQLLTNNHHVTDADLNALLKAVKQAAKELQKDQQVCCRLVESLRFIVPHLQAAHDSQSGPSPSEGLLLCRDLFYKTVSSFWQLACDGAPPLKLRMAELLLDLIKFDPECGWGQLMVESNGDSGQSGRDSPGFSLVTVRQQFPRVLLESSVDVRAFVARSLHWLFVGSMSLKNETQIKIFEEIFMLSSELLNTERGSALCQRDEVSNGQAIFLHVLLTIIKCSPVCEKPCLLGLMQMMTDREISLQLVRKMLHEACSHLGYSNVERYLESHLPYLVYNWLHDDMVGSPLETFPFQLLGHEDVTGFTVAYPDLIVSMLLATKLEVSQVRERLTSAKLDVRSTLLVALPDILVHILPQFAAKSSQDGGLSSSQQVLQKHFKTSHKCFAALKHVLSEQEINDRISETLGIMVVKVLSCLHVESASDSMVYPEPNPPYYSEDKIILTLDYLAQDFSVDKEKDQFSLVGVLAKIPDGLHQVFLSLSSQLWREHRAHEQSRCVNMMAIFVRLVLRDLKPEGRGDSIRAPAVVILRDILNRLLVILRSRVGCDKKATLTSPSYEEDVILSCLQILHDVCQCVLASCPQELVQFLHCLVDTVSHVAGASEAAGRAALRILCALTGEGPHAGRGGPRELEEGLALLNPLPNIPVLAELRASLERRYTDSSGSMSQMLTDFSSMCTMTSSRPSQGLALRLESLARCISVNHEQIQEMLSSAQGLAQVRDVMQHLSRLSTSSHTAVAAAAASCLGAIGPVNLQVLSLKAHLASRTGSGPEDGRAQELGKYFWLFQALDVCLLHESLEVVATAGKILQRIMATESSKQFEKLYVKLTKGQGSLFRYLHPFRNCCQDLLEPDPQPYQALHTLDRRELWLGQPVSPTSGPVEAHGAWVKALVRGLLSTGLVKDELLCRIGPLCALEVDFCESSLPYLIHETLLADTEDCRQIISRQLSAFFHMHVEQANSDNYPLVMNKKSIRTLLAVVQYLRTQKRPQQSPDGQHTVWHNNMWLDLNYLDLARAAQFCGASFTAVLFTEIHWGIRRQAEENQHSQEMNSGLLRGSQGRRSAPKFQTVKEREKCEAVLMEAYKTIGDPDGLYGCGAGRQTNINTRVETYLHEQQQEKALITLDIAMCNDPTLNTTHLLQVLKSCGADYLLQQCLPKMQSQISSPSGSRFCRDQDELDEFSYEAAWKLGQWDLCPPQRRPKQSPFHESVYACLTSVKDGHLDVAFECLQAARLNVVHSFDLTAETCMHLYPFLSQLQCLGYLEQVLLMLEKHTEDSGYLMDHPIPVSCQLVEFSFKETLLHLMSATGRTLESLGVKQGEAMEIKALWNLALGGRKAKYFQCAERAIQTLKLKHSARGPGGSTDLTLTLEQLQLEEAKLFWARSEVDTAKTILHGLLWPQTQQGSQSQQTCDPDTHLQSLVLYGNWLAETKSETPSVIMDFFQNAVDLIKGKNKDSLSDKTGLHAFASLASFADQQYQAIVDYMQSPDYEEKCRLVRQSKTEVEEYQKLHVGNRITVETIRKHIKIDEQEVAALQEDRERFLHQALDAYLQCLVRGNLHDLRISRVLGLWFDNSAMETINKMVMGYVPRLQSHKFLLLVYQLAARMGVHKPGTRDSSFNSTLTQLLERITVEHPHHSLWVVLALAHAHRDSDFTAADKDQGKGRNRGSTEDAGIEEERVQAAKNLLERVSRTKSMHAGVHLNQIVDGMRRFSLGCIQLANLPVDKKGGSHSFTVPSSLAITKLQNLEHVQVPIVELPIDPAGCYTDLITLTKFERAFRTAGGINLPKIISLLCSDGLKRTSLVKGRDDLRQDAVMQQVFSLVNQLLSADQQTRLRQLSIRTYK